MPPTADKRCGQVPATNPAPTNGIEFVIHNDDLLTEILLRLPAKSLIRFKSVCKKWLSLISSDQFCYQHTLRRPKLQPSLLINIKSPQNLKNLFYSCQIINGGKGKLTMTRTPYHMSSIFEQHRIIQACNGLMLLESIFIYEEKVLLYYDIPRSYYVYNPATRKSREIILPENPKYSHVAAVSLAFDPSKSPYYKIVCIRLDASLERSYVEVFESESQSWKMGLGAFNSPNLAISSYRGNGGVYWNNSIYWKMIDEPAYYRFDIDKNEMKKKANSFAHIDNDPNIRYSESYLQESNGRLYHLLKIYHYRFERETHVLNFGLESELPLRVLSAHFGLGSELPELPGWESEYVALWELGRGDDDDDDDDDHHHMHSPWLFKYQHSLGMNVAGANVLTVRSGSDEDGDETCSLLVHWDGKVRAYNFLDKTYQDLFYSRTEPLVFQFGETLALV